MQEKKYSTLQMMRYFILREFYRNMLRARKFVNPKTMKQQLRPITQLIVMCLSILFQIVWSSIPYSHML